MKIPLYVELEAKLSVLKDKGLLATREKARGQQPLNCSCGTLWGRLYKDQACEALRGKESVC